MSTPIHTRTAAGLAAAVASGELTAQEAVEAHLERIAEADPAVNAVTTPLADRARAEAAQVDRRRAAGERLGPLAGVPFTVKENVHVAGTATTFGVPRLRDLVAREDAPPVRRLRAAGAVCVGRTNLPDMTLGGVHTRSTLYGDTVNPWDPGRTPGGTSGGDAVAVATGMAPLGLGNDSGGSVRVPAAFCGVAGLKPGYGRIASDHRVGGREPTLAAQMFPVDGPIARSVGDLRLALSVLAGPDAGDPRALPVPLEGPPLPGPVRVGVAAEPFGPGTTDPAAHAAVAAAAEALQDAGYAVQDAVPPQQDEALEAYARLTTAEFALARPQIEELMGEEARRHIAYSSDRNPPPDLAGYVQAAADRLGAQRAWARFQEEVPLLLGPVFTGPVPAPGEELVDPGAHERVTRGLGLCAVTTCVGVPAVAVPVGTAGGLPRSVQVIGPMHREDLCLEAAEAIERRFGALAPVDPRGIRHTRTAAPPWSGTTGPA
ncbi:amidase [Nocardiopsis suaedae]|uniref:Amidase family protein n=1 Tax=Nocardiopsis suaedae TaxID=3018444 RepID=A0ABT4TJY8_9ACTN|nr:amidase family protein [Nocardiopsis suaedae]MDA2804988.1 amidase family protein [Nocardiopsis suaedae]